jgi:hypothetical protein
MADQITDAAAKLVLDEATGEHVSKTERKLELHSLFLTL